jgi:hypothetical protein
MRLPAARRLLAFSAAAGALTVGAPALAQAAGDYEYAQPAPAGGVVFHSDPMVQALPMPPAPMAGEWVDEAADLPPPPLPPMPPVPPAPLEVIYAAPPAAYAMPQAYGAPYPYPGAYPGYAQPLPPQFDRDGWLANCHDRIRGVDRQDRAGEIGGLLGAAIGGVVGNRAWDSKRFAGTLLGAGVGGLAGVAIGTAIGAAGERRHEDDCALYLDRYLADGHGYPGYAYGYPGYGYGYGGYALVPVLVAVPQRQVVRETVTEEWVDVPVRSRSIPPRRHPAPHPAPRQTKPTKYIKTR